MTNNKRWDMHGFRSARLVEYMVFVLEVELDVVANWLWSLFGFEKKAGVDRGSERFRRRRTASIAQARILRGDIEQSSVIPRQTLGCSVHPSSLGLFVEPTCAFGVLKHSLERG
jgi:hypothetical protein